MALRMTIGAAKAGEWPATVTNVYVAEHDYGPVYAKDGGFSVFPEVHVFVAMEEL